MFLHIARLPEPQLALGTPIRLLVRVHLHVVLEAAKRQKLLVARQAEKVLLPFVRQIVAPEIAGALKRLFALGAAERLGVVMDLLVAAQISRPVERLLALVAAKLPLPGVRQHVVPQDVRADESFATQLTLVALAATVRLLVRVEAGSTGQHLVTLGTRVLGGSNQRLL